MSGGTLEVPAAATTVQRPRDRRQHTPGQVVVVGGRNRRPLLRHGSWPLLRSLTRQSLVTRYQQSGLRVAWSVIQPLALIGVYALFFKGVLQVDAGEVPYLSFIVAGVIPWRFISNGFTASSSITENIHLISKVYFPKEMVPLSAVLAGLAELAVGTFIMVGVVAAGGHLPTYHVLALPLPFLLMVLFTCAIGVLLATVSVFVRDVAHAMPFVLMGAFFATPIMYTEDHLPEWLQWFPAVNPFAVAIDAIRDLLIHGRWFPPGPLVVHLVAASLLLLGSLAYVRSVESRMVDLA